MPGTVAIVAFSTNLAVMAVAKTDRSSASDCGMGGGVAVSIMPNTMGPAIPRRVRRLLFSSHPSVG